MQRQEGVFASLLAELRAEAEESHQVLLDEERDRERCLVQLPLPGIGTRPVFIGAQDVRDQADERARLAPEEERWTTRDGGREPKRAPARRRERILSLKGRRIRMQRPPSEHDGLARLDDASLPPDPREDSLVTRCGRLSLRFQAHQEVVVVREPMAGGRGRLEVRETDAGADLASSPYERGTLFVELDRVRVLKPAGVLAHLQALDRALVSDG